MSEWPNDPIWTDEEQSYWLAFDRVGGAGLGAAKLRLAYDRLGSLKKLWDPKPEDLRQVPWFTPELQAAFFEKRKSVDPEKVFNDLKKIEVRAYPLMHPNYPFRLREIHDPPLIIYIKGHLPPDEFPHACSIVGTRKPSNYGERLAKQFGFGLASNGVAVISGMALGIDSIAHWGAIEGGGKTIAVLATGVDVCYPYSNKPLYKELIEKPNGAVLSEFFPGTKAEPWRFPSRNRIISGLSQAVLVIEAGETSGSLITARLGFEQNREIFAVPGRVDSPASNGTHMLIKNTMAHLCTGVDDIMKQMNWVAAAPFREVPTVVELFGRERELFEMLSNEPVHFDFLCERSGIPAPELSATLTMLELAGVIEHHPGDWYSRQFAVTTK